MPLTSKLKADYAELINQQLDTIRIDTAEDFTWVQQALHNIIQPVTTYQVLEKYKEQMFWINDYLKDPGDYVEDANDYDEYKKIIKDRIVSKINEFKSLSEPQKLEYIENQQAQRSQTAANQQTISQHQPPQPGTDAHVLTEAQWHAQMEQAMNQNSAVSNHTPPVRNIIQQTVHRIYGTEPRERSRVLEIEEMRRAANAYDRTVRRERSRVLATAEQIRRAVNAGHGLFTAEDLVGVEINVAYWLTKPETHEAIRDGLFTGKDAARMEDGNVAFKFTQPICLAAIREGLFTAEDIINIKDVNVTHQLLQPQCLAAIREGRTTLVQIVALDVSTLHAANTNNDYPPPPSSTNLTT